MLVPRAPSAWQRIERIFCPAPARIASDSSTFQRRSESWLGPVAAIAPFRNLAVPPLPRTAGLESGRGFSLVKATSLPVAPGLRARTPEARLPTRPITITAITPRGGAPLVTALIRRDIG